MLPMFFLATLAWILALVYYKKCRPIATDENTLGPRFVGTFIAGFLISLLLMYCLSRKADQSKPPAPTPAPAESAPLDPEDTDQGDPQVSPPPAPKEQGLGLSRWIFIGVALMFFYTTFVFLLLRAIRYLTGGDESRTLAWAMILAILIWGLFLMKVAWNPAVVGNILIFLIILPVLELSVRLRKSGFIGMFSLIMALDIFLVWAFNRPAEISPINPIQASGDNWYISIFRSKFMEHFPWPVGFRWGGRMLGNGDVFFICLTVMYLRRVWNLRAAIIAGVLVTLPLLVIPWLSELLGIYAWPYTIFIAPVALVMAMLAPYRIYIPEDWQELDGDPGVIGRYPKS